ncbi:MAG: hypothetical protein H7069_04200 [Phormidesmis sp. FL-bin-119]|nr:hypothetical protein [Pedobacter sp.]
MLSEDFNKNAQAEARKLRSLNLRVSYSDESSVKLNKALHYVVDKIGFKPMQDFTFVKESEEMRLYDSTGNTLILNLEKHETGVNRDTIIFYTDDCLRDYHKYIVSGVKFISRPEYTEAGLQVCFRDQENNRYILLEERSYTEHS